MNIVLVITDYGSFNNFLGELAISIKRAGHNVTVICSKNKVIKVDDKYDYKALGINFFYVDFPRGFNFIKHYKASKIIQKYINSINPDFISLHFTTGIFTSTFIGKLPYPSSGTFHGLGFPVVEGAIKKLIYKIIELNCISKLDETWVLNQLDYEVLSKLGIKNVKLLPTKGLGCDLEKFNPLNFTDSAKQEIRESLSILPHEKVITFTGRYVYFKGFHKVVQAFKNLINEKGYENVKLVLIGGPDPVHSTGLSEKDQIWLNNCTQIINIGFTSQVEKYLSISDIFVFPSDKEGMPVCIIEALAMGIPVITNDSRGCNDLIKDRHNGLLLNNESTPTEISSSIELLLKDENLRDSIKSNIVQEREQLNRLNFVNNQLKEILN